MHRHPLRPSEPTSKSGRGVLRGAWESIAAEYAPGCDPAPLTRVACHLSAETSSNTFTGIASIDGGAIKLNSPLGLQNSTVGLNVAGGLLFGPGVQSPIIGGLNGSGSMALTTTDLLPVTLTVGGGGGASGAYTGVLSGSSTGSSLVMNSTSGTGSLILGAANTYGGSTTVNGGTLALGINGALPGTTALTVSGTGANFNLATYTDTVAGVTLSNLGTISGTSGVLTVSNTSSYALQSGIVSGILGGTAPVNKTTGGFVVLSGANTYSGSTTITAGGITTGVNNALPTGGSVAIIGNTSDLDLVSYTNTVAGVSLQGGRLLGTTANQLTDTTAFAFQSGFVTAGLAGSAGLQKTTTGTLFLGGPGSNFTGGTTISGSGTVILGADTALGAAGSAVTVNSGGVLDINGKTTLANALSLNGAGAGAGALVNNATVQNDYYTYAGAVTLATSATIGGLNNLIISGALTETGAATLTKTGPGILWLQTAASGAANTTYISQGMLRLGNVTAAGTGPITINPQGDTTFPGSGGILNLATAHNGAATMGFGQINILTGPAVIEVDDSNNTNGWNGGNYYGAYTVGQININSQNLIVRDGNFGSSSAGATSLTTGAVNMTGNPTFEVGWGQTGLATLTLGALNDNSTARTITKTSQGMLILNTAATSLVQGTVLNISQGTVQSNVAGALGTDATINMYPTGFMGTTAFWVTANQQIGALNSNGRLGIAANVTLTIGNTADNLNSNFTGTISDGNMNMAATTGAITKVGTGVLTMSGQSWDTGAFTISGGTVIGLDNNNVLGTMTAATAVSMSNGTTLSIEANGSPYNFNIGTITTGGGTATVNVQHDAFTSTNPTANVLAFVGGLTTTGANQTIAITGDSGYGLKLAGASSLAAGYTTTLSVPANMSLELAGAMAATSGSLNLVSPTAGVGGNGLVILSGANTQTGNITVNPGITLRATQAASFGAGTGANTLTLAGGLLDLRNDAATSFGRNVTVTANSTINADTWSTISGYNQAVTPVPTAAIAQTLGNLTMGAYTLNATSGDGVGLTFGTVTLTGSATFNVGAGVQETLGAFQSSSSPFAVTGNGLLVLNAAAVAGYTGSASVNGATLRLENATALNSNAILVNSGALELDAFGANSTFANPVTLANGTTLRGFGNFANQQTVNYTVTYNATGGLVIPSAATVAIQTGSNVIDYQPGVPYSFYDLFTLNNGLNGGGSGAQVNLNGSGRLVFASSGNFSGSVNVNMATGGMVLMGNATSLV